jgi:uncharacterized protein YndB with AHSA1/START domain
MTAQPHVAPADHVLSLTRVFQASREAVFRAFTDREQVKNWFGPKGFSAEIDQFEPRVGGRYRLNMIEPNGTPHWLNGRFVAIEPYERLVYTWCWEQGDLKGLETLVTVRFMAVGDATELRLEHSRMPSEGARDAHGKGWSSSFEGLMDHLQGKRRERHG